MMIMVPAPYLAFHKVGVGDVSLDEDIEVRKVNVLYIPPEYFYATSFIHTCSWEAEVKSEYLQRIFVGNISQSLLKFTAIEIFGGYACHLNSCK